MFLLSVTDLEGRQVQVNGSSIAWFAKDSAGKGTVITFAVPGASGPLTLRVADTPEQITTLVNAKLRK